MMFNLVQTTIRYVIVGGAKLSAGPGRETADATTLGAGIATAAEQ